MRAISKKSDLKLICSFFANIYRIEFIKFKKMRKIFFGLNLRQT